MKMTEKKSEMLKRIWEEHANTAQEIRKLLWDFGCFISKEVNKAIKEERRNER